jgi:polar amino acid transport system permease protein
MPNQPHPRPERRELPRWLSFTCAFLLLGGVAGICFSKLEYQWDWTPVFRYWRLFAEGWGTTIAIASIALPLSTLFGLALTFARRCPVRILRDTSRLWIELTRGTPLLVQIWLYFYVFAQALHLENRYLLGPLILSAFSGAYISEILRAGIDSVSASQLESAQAIGLTRAQTYRYVIFPQTIRQVLPPIAGQFVSLVKDSSLLSVLGLNELTLAAQQVNSFTYAAFESYLPVSIGYLLLTLPISLWTQSLEKRARFET